MVVGKKKYMKDRIARDKHAPVTHPWFKLYLVSTLSGMNEIIAPTL